MEPMRYFLAAFASGLASPVAGDSLSMLASTTPRLLCVPCWRSLRTGPSMTTSFTTATSEKRLDVLTLAYARESSRRLPSPKPSGFAMTRPRMSAEPPRMDMSTSLTVVVAPRAYVAPLPMPALAILLIKRSAPTRTMTSTAATPMSIFHLRFIAAPVQIP